MAKRGDSASEARKEKPQCGVLFELETVALKGRKLVYEALKKVLASRDAELSPGLFCRFCLQSSPRQYMPPLLEALGKGRFSPDKVLEEDKAGINAAFAGKHIALDNGLARLLKNAVNQHLVVGTLSGLEPAVAEGLVNALGLKTFNVKLLCGPSSDRDFPTVDSWMKLAKLVSMSSLQCIALASSAVSCRAVLASGMRCVVVPDEFTSFQDFGGADLVVDKVDERTLRDVIALMKVRLP
jgi:beta-phosphoglucomutase-like phosphatase (HAD superfamily)